MSAPNPFADDLRNAVLINSSLSASPLITQQSAPSGMSSELVEKIAKTSNNPLIGYASPLLTLAVQLRHAEHYSNVEGLRETLMREIKRLNENLSKHGIEANTIKAVSYNLCAFLDETVLYTPWGANNSLWRTQGLSVIFHNDTFGGERFFQWLAEVLQKPTQYLDLLEFLYLCLSLGFQGRYRHLANGEIQLLTLQQEVYSVLRAHLGGTDKELSPHWRNLQNNRNALPKSVSPWWFVAIGSGFLGIAFLSFYFYIASVEMTRIINTPAITALQEWQAFLKQEQDENKVVISQDNGNIVIRLIGDNLFASASDQLSYQYYDLIDKIGREFAQKMSGKEIFITGYTDDKPLKYPTQYLPSNQVLSEKRARTVLRRLQRQNPILQRLNSRGLAEQEPWVPNDTEENRAKNRRVDISFEG
jgi:type VI secretion system protein ImpK